MTTNGTTEGDRATEGDRTAIELWALGQVEREWTMRQSQIMVALDVQHEIARRLGIDKAAIIADHTRQLEECAVALQVIADRRASVATKVDG